MFYLVIKRGVYIQDAFGPLHTLVPAKALAQGFAADDVDSYHHWEVQSVSPRGGLSGEPLASYRKRQLSKDRPDMDYLDARSEDKQREKAKRANS